MKAREIGELRTRTLTENRSELEAAATMLRTRLGANGTLFAFGNGGSATDAMDLVADLRAAPQGWPGRRCLDLTDDPAILTALANDIGPASLYARQLIAFDATATSRSRSRRAAARPTSSRRWPRRDGAASRPSPSWATTAAASRPSGWPIT